MYHLPTGHNGNNVLNDRSSPIIKDYLVMPIQLLSKSIVRIDLFDFVDPCNKTPGLFFTIYLVYLFIV